MQKLKNLFAGRVTRTAQAAVGAGAMAGMGFASAAIDIGDTITTLTEGATAVASIGTAALSIVVAVKIFKFVRTAL